MVRVTLIEYVSSVNRELSTRFGFQVDETNTLCDDLEVFWLEDQSVETAVQHIIKQRDEQ